MVSDLKELSMKASIAKHVEFSKIHIDFDKRLKLKDIQDNAIFNMLHNVENRI